MGISRYRALLTLTFFKLHLKVCSKPVEAFHKTLVNKTIDLPENVIFVE